MSRNVESRFAINPTNIDISRSKFDRNSSVKLSGNVGDIIPFYCDEVLPGDTFSIRTSKVVRFQPMVCPIMDNIMLDSYYFFVPNRLVWEHWRQFMGENTASAWIPSASYSVPQLKAPSGGWSCGTIADYLGIPIGVDNITVNALPFRAVALICNEWFRDENLSQPLAIPVTDSQVTGSNGSNYVTDVAKGGMPYRAAKYHDYFTSCLPAPQKGPDVSIPVAAGGSYPVVVGDMVDKSLMDNTKTLQYTGYTKNGNTWVSDYQQPILNTSANTPANMTYIGSGANKTPPYSSGGTNPTYYNSVHPANLWAIDSGGAQAATINQLRLAFQIQKLYEKDARGGTRYIEVLKSHFGVTSPDSRLQRPEYLGGNRIPIHINQVLQQSATQSGSTPQANPAAISLTSDVHGDFSHSFTEHGFVIGLMVVRYPHTYQQGIERQFSRKTRFDYYWPVLANLGEQAVLNKEIYVQGSTVLNPSTGNAYDDEVFGYQERWAEYRYKPNRVAGEMRSDYSTPLDMWHLADDYGSMPTLSSSWIMEDKSPVDRALAVTSSVSDQFWADIYVENTTTRAMPMYSIPGLIDHH